MALRYPIIAIVGRPNVGKSTLFNYLVGEEQAVVKDEPGVTRDRNIALVERYSVPFFVVDTGGFIEDPNGVLEQGTRQQLELAVEEADIVVVMFDGKVGLSPDDEDVVKFLRGINKPFRYAVNKCDGPEHSGKIVDFYSLGVEEICDLSALHGYGVRMFIEETLCSLPEYERLSQSWQALKSRELEEEELTRVAAKEKIREAKADYQVLDERPEEKPDFLTAPKFAKVFNPEESDLSEGEYFSANRLRDLPNKKTPEMVSEVSLMEDEGTVPAEINVAIVGRPNVGKSTLLNTLLGEKRAITSPIAGTTRDSLEASFVRDGTKLRVVDTAGLRKKARIDNQIEQVSVMQALRALGQCDVAVLVIDAVRGVEEQETKIAGLAHSRGCGLVIAVNKWDAIEKNHRSVKEFEKRVREQLRFVPYAPIVFVSALSGKRCTRIVDMVRHVAKERTKRVDTGALNRLLKRAISHKNLSIYRGRPLRLYYGAQVAVSPPRFMLFFNQPKGVHFSYMRF